MGSRGLSFSGLLLAAAVFSLSLVGQPLRASADFDAAAATCDEVAITAEVGSLSAITHDAVDAGANANYAGLLDEATRIGTHLEQCFDQLPSKDQAVVIRVIFDNRNLRVSLLERLHRSSDALTLAQDTLDKLNQAIDERPDDGQLLEERPRVMSEVASLVAANATPAPVVFITPTQTCRDTTAVDPSNHLTSEVKVAQCLAAGSHRNEAIAILRAALHSLPAVSLAGDLELAYDLLATLEYANGDRRAAAAHLADAYTQSKSSNNAALDSKVKNDLQLLAPQTYRRLQANENAEASAIYDQVTAGMSGDQKKVFNDEGAADHVESYESANYTIVTWWYNNTEGGGYRIGYTFTNGVLTQVYRP